MKYIHRILPATALVLMAGLAHAATILTPPVQYTFGPAQTTIELPVLVDQFDPADFGGAELTSVHIILHGEALSGPGLVECVTGGQASGTCSGTLESSITIDLKLGSTLLTTVIPLTSFVYGPLTPGGSVIVPIASDSKTSSELIFLDPPDGAFVSQFSGNGTVQFNIIGTGLVTTTNGDGFVLSGNPLVGSGYVQIQYDYQSSVVPEPATMTMLGGGLIGLAVIARRKTRKA